MDRETPKKSKNRARDDLALHNHLSFRNKLLVSPSNSLLTRERDSTPIESQQPMLQTGHGRNGASSQNLQIVQEPANVEDMSASSKNNGVEAVILHNYIKSLARVQLRLLETHPSRVLQDYLVNLVGVPC